MLAALVLQATLTIGVAGPATAPEYLPVRLAEAGPTADGAPRPLALRSFRSTVDAAEALAAGRVDLVATSLDAALRVGHAHGAPPRLLFGLTAAPPVALLTPAGKQDQVRVPADLAGKTVGITAPGTAEAEALTALLTRAGVRPERVRITSFGERLLARAVAAGEIDAAIIGDPWATRLVAEGEAVIVADLRRPDEAARWLGKESVHAGVFVAATSRLDAAALIPVTRALLVAQRRVRSAPADELAASLAGSVVGDPEDFALRVEGARALFLDDGLVSPEALEAGIDLIQARARLPAVVKLPRLDRLLFLEPLRRAQETLGRGAGLSSPQRARSRRVASTGSPTTLVKQPSTSRTSRPPSPCTA
jgi:NitT/TauT family transport system substrate-binding protein